MESGQRRIACAKIVDVNFDAPPSQVAEHRGGVLRVIHYFAFGNLQVQAFGRYPMPFKGAHDFVRQLPNQQLLASEVDMDGSQRRAAGQTLP